MTRGSASEISTSCPGGAHPGQGPLASGSTPLVRVSPFPESPFLLLRRRPGSLEERSPRIFRRDRAGRGIGHVQGMGPCPDPMGAGAFFEQPRGRFLPGVLRNGRVADASLLRDLPGSVDAAGGGAVLAKVLQAGGPGPPLPGRDVRRTSGESDGGWSARRRRSRSFGSGLSLRREPSR